MALLLVCAGKCQFFFFTHLHNCPKTEVAFPERFAELDLEFHYINRDSKK